MGFSKDFKSLMDISRNLILVRFSGFFVCRVDISGILILVEFSRISRLIESSGFFKCRVSIREFLDFSLALE